MSKLKFNPNSPLVQRQSLLWLSLLAVMLFIVQPPQASYAPQAPVASEQADADCSDSDIQLIKAGYSALVPVGSFVVAQLPSYLPQLSPQIDLPDVLHYQAPRGITLFFKTLFSRIIAPNAP